MPTLHAHPTRPLHAIPTRSNRTPRYPTRLAVLDDPCLLEARQPVAWRRHREFAAVAGALLAAQVGCREQIEAPPSSPSASASGGAIAAAVVAPLFDFGKGRATSQLPRAWGLLGCIAVAAPTFLPEDEALRIIAAELAKYGLRFTTRHVEHPEITVPSGRVETGHEWVSGQSQRQLFEEPAPLVIDLEDPQHRVAIEYVAWDDYLPLGGHVRENKDAWVSDLRDAVRVAGESVARDGRGFHFGAFYDPVVYCRFWGDPLVFDPDAAQRAPTQPTTDAPDADREDSAAWSTYLKSLDERQAVAQEHARQLLLQQVRDFADWLKAQGVI